MGEMGLYKKALNRIMRKAENLEYDGIKGFTNILDAEFIDTFWSSKNNPMDKEVTDAAKGLF